MTTDPTTEIAAAELDEDQSAVWAVLLDLYQAYLDSDRPRLEAHIADECTLFDSAQPSMMTKADLQRVRSDEPSTDPRPYALPATNPIIRIWDDTALEVHSLGALFEDESLNQTLRCSSVLRRVDGRWLIVHHHEELLTAKA